MSLQTTFDQARIGNVYHASNQAAVTLSGLSTTATGLILSNPFGSGKNIGILTVGWMFSTAPGGASVVGLAMSPTVSSTQVTHGTPINAVQNAILAGTQGVVGVGKVDSAATTVGTPVFIRTLGGPVAASQISPPYIRDDIDGSLILPPGTSVQLAFLTTAAVGLGYISWVEYTP